MNNVFNKEKRREFCIKLMESRNNERMIVFVDETNFNVHISRTKGWAKKGQRAVVKMHSRKAPNLNVMCAISTYQRACINFETKRGSVTKEVFTEFIKRTVLNCFEVLDEVNDTTGITIVFDNAPCHYGVEDSLQNEEYLQSGRVQLLRLGPYSPQLNPIEGCFSSFKAKVKKILGRQRHEFENRGQDPSQLQKRFRLLEEAATAAKSVFTLRLTYNQERHCEANIQKALNLEDMPMS